MVRSCTALVTLSSEQPSSAPSSAQVSPNPNTIFTVGGIVVVVVLLAAVFVNRARLPHAEEQERRLNAEMNNLVPPPDARLVDRRGTVKGSSVVVGAHYRSSTNSHDLVEHFQRQLSQHGWYACASGDRRYCKGAFHAVLESRPNVAPTDWDVALDLTWGLD